MDVVHCLFLVICSIALLLVGFLWISNSPKNSTKKILICLSISISSLVILALIIYWERIINDGTGERKYITPNVWDNYTIEAHVKPLNYNSDSSTKLDGTLRIVSRLQWLAAPPADTLDLLENPVPLVIIHHTATETCDSLAKCVFSTRHIQEFHMESNNWKDIGYNFLVGGDGSIYEGRGWNYQGAHTFGFNHKSLGIAFIGFFFNEVPPKKQIDAFNKLVEEGVKLGHIQKNYKILGARQLSPTESPGKAFMDEIETWPHWSKEVDQYQNQ